MASTLPPRPRTPSPQSLSRITVIPPTPALSDSNGSDESPILVNPASRKPLDRHSRKDSAKMATIRSRRASDAGVLYRRDSILHDTLPADESTGNVPAAALARPVVDEAIKGIPQGWEDDISIAIPATPVRPKPTPLPPITGKTPRNIGRLQSFRALPQKGNPLAAWRGRKVSNIPPVPLVRKQADGAQVAIENLESIPAPARARLGLFTLPPAVDPSRQAGRRVNKLRRPAGDLYHIVTARTSQSTEDAFRSVVEVDTEPPASAYSSKKPETLELEQRNTVNTASTSSLPTSLVETPATENTRYAPSIASQDSARSNRDRVLGLVPGAGTTVTQPKVYRQPELHEVLPFAAGRPFSAWDLGPGQTPPPRTRKPSLVGLGVERVQAEHGASLVRRSSLPSRRSERQERAQHSISVAGPSRISQPTKAEGWSEPGSGPLSKGRRDWVDSEGKKVAPHYLLGWEREVLDLEARLHETLQDLAGGSHTFATFDRDHEPASVLDIGTGTGAWPISQSLVWRNTRFVGIDAAPIQIDLQALAQAERVARSTSKGQADGEGVWEGIAKRVTWDRLDIETLPYDSGVFSFVHVRFLALGITELHGASLLEEIVRVLAPGGTLEIVEMGVTLPPACPAPMKAAFAKALLHEMVNPDPSLPIKFNIPTIDGLVQSTFAKPVFERTWRLPSGDPGSARTSKGKEKEKEADAPPAAIAEAGPIWMKSVLQYSKLAMSGARSGPSLGLAGDDVNKKRNEPADPRFLDAFRAGLGSKWDFGAVPESKEKKDGREGKTAHGLDAENAMLSVAKPDVTELQLWAWVGKRKG